MKKKIIIILILVALIIVGISVYFFLIKTPNVNNNNNINNQVEENIEYTEGFYSYLNENDDKTYTLIIASNTSDIDTKQIQVYYNKYDYSNAILDSKTNNYKMVGPKFYDTEINYKITKIIIKDKIYPTKTTMFFSGLSDVKEIENIENIDLRRTTSTAGMFEGCTSLTSLDLSSFNMKNVEDTSLMFAGCTNLKIIYVNKDKWNLNNVKYSNNMFYNTTSIEGENHTKYDETKLDKTYAQIDSSKTKGYLSSK